MVSFMAVVVMRSASPSVGDPRDLHGMKTRRTLCPQKLIVCARHTNTHTDTHHNLASPRSLRRRRRRR